MIDSSSPGTIIFHHPGPLFVDARAGSQVRPKQLLCRLLKRWVTRLCPLSVMVLSASGKCIVSSMI